MSDICPICGIHTKRPLVHALSHNDYERNQLAELQRLRAETGKGVVATKQTKRTVELPNDDPLREFFITDES